MAYIPIITIAGSDSKGPPIDPITGDMFVGVDGLSSVYDGVAWEEINREVARAAAMDEDDIIMKATGIKSSVKDRFLELLEQYPELTRGQAYIQAVMEIAEPAIRTAVKKGCAPVVVKATIGNLDGWRYCVMKVKDDDHQANLD